MKIVTMIVVLLLGACASQVDRGQRLFFNCDVDRATFQCKKGSAGPAAFAGNGRTCATCHSPLDNFSISPTTIQGLPKTDPLFVDVPGLENSDNLLAFGLILVNAPGPIVEFRETPKLTHLRDLCSSSGKCGPLGLRGDRERDLCKFSNQAIANHLTKDIQRRPGVDFKTMTESECEAMVAYLLSERVADVKAPAKSEANEAKAQMEGMKP